jgi:hypothetical protein
VTEWPDRWPTHAGHLCASHVGEWVELNGQRGQVFSVCHDLRHSFVRIVLKDVRGIHVVDVPHDTVLTKWLGPRWTEPRHESVHT